MLYIYKVLVSSGIHNHSKRSAWEPVRTRTMWCGNNIQTKIQSDSMWHSQHPSYAPCSLCGRNDVGTPPFCSRCRMVLINFSISFPRFFMRRISRSNWGFNILRLISQRDRTWSANASNVSNIRVPRRARASFIAFLVVLFGMLSEKGIACSSAMRL